MGGNFVRVKAEVSFDGEQITRYYLEQEQDIIKILQVLSSYFKWNTISNYLINGIKFKKY